MDENIRVGRQIRLSARCKFSIDFACTDMTVRANDFRHDRRVVSDAATKVIDPLSALEIECVYPFGQSCGLTIVAVTRGIKSHENVAAEMPPVTVVRLSV